METITFEKDIPVMYVTAASTPAGVMDAHQKIRSLVKSWEGRKYLGISRPEQGVINYKAAAEILSTHEPEELNLETLTLKKGKYASVTVADFMSDLPRIGSTFSEILARPDIDPEGYCIEWYFNDKDVKCMVRLTD